MAIKNRSRMEIMRDIVSAARPTARKTHLMYKSNLSFKQLDLYLNALMDSGLVEERLDDELGRLYTVTPRGLNFIELFETMRSYLSSGSKKKNAFDDDMLSVGVTGDENVPVIRTAKAEAFFY